MGIKKHIKLMEISQITSKDAYHILADMLCNFSVRRKNTSHADMEWLMRLLYMGNNLLQYKVYTHHHLLQHNIPIDRA